MNKMWIKSYRKKIEWRWYRHPATAHLFDYLLHVAEFSDCKRYGIELRTGQVLTTYRKMAEETGLSLMQVRRAITNLNTTKKDTQLDTELDVQTTRHFSIITIKNWNKYQPLNTQVDTQLDTEGNTEGNTETDTLYKKNKEYRIKNIIPQNKVLVPEAKKSSRDEEVKHFVWKLNENEDFKLCLLAWLVYRKELKTTKQWEFQYKTLKKFDNFAEVVENSIGNGYQGLFAPKKSDVEKPKTQEANRYEYIK